MSKQADIELLKHRVDSNHEYAGQAHERCTIMEYAIRGFDSRLKALESAQPQQGEGGNSPAQSSPHNIGYKFADAHAACLDTNSLIGERMSSLEQKYFIFGFDAARRIA